ncbi:MAG: KUP/HAK/KT family potassium transporter, partial [Verrucomicrobiae bacterium]|nr:KUP/HAK/KT family potassium transporter [Verrucomicrobiae bacterium]
MSSAKTTEAKAAAPAQPSPSHSSPPPRKDLALLALAAIGIVYGDIGTSPLYAIKECFDPNHGVAVTAGNTLGILSLFFWSLMLVVVIKYMTVVLRADNHGEGGILALITLMTPRSDKPPSRVVGRLVLLGLFGAALLLSDGLITPAISV